MQWYPYNRTGVTVDGIIDLGVNYRISQGLDSDPTDIGMRIPFNIVVKLPGGQIILQSDGKVPNYNQETGEIENYQLFDQDIFDSFQITVDQLEGEINLPYVFKRDAIFTPESTATIFGTEVTISAQTNAFQSIEVPRSPLGGFAQFRINYQYVDFTNQEVYTGEVITPRVLVPRFVTPPPPPPPPVFTIDDGQIKEALADKIYEKFFSSELIQGNLDDLKSFQSTQSPDGIGYKRGRESDDDQLIFFKKDRNTPENQADFNGDGSDGIQQIALDISSSYANTDANGVIDLSDKLDNELSIQEAPASTRVPSTEPPPGATQEEMDSYEPLFIFDTQTPLYYVENIAYKLIYTSDFSGEIIEVEFASFNRFFENNEGDQRYQEDGQNKPDQWLNKLNLSQLTKPKISTKVDSDKAKNILDTDIFELLPNQGTRQGQINDLFTRFYDLIGTPPTFQDVDQDGAEEKLINDFSPRISSDPDNQSAYVTRTNEEADEVNEGKTLQSMRDELNNYLGDVDNVIEEFPELQEYKNKSEGFLKIRKPNQAIIIRSNTDVMPLLERRTVTEILDPQLVVLDGDSLSLAQSYGFADAQINDVYTERPVEGASWAVEGFTITMWVRFLNSTTGGSLMTFGNPMLKEKTGFRLDTHTRSDFNPDNNQTTNRRMVRLVVWEKAFSGGAIYDSHFGRDFTPNPDGRGAKYQTWQSGGNPAYEEFSAMEDGSWHVFLQHTQIPTDDLQEWFFICATYDPLVDEEGSFDDINLYRDTDFWLNKKEYNGNIVANSGFGNKCKVEVISRSDLLRARGFKV